MSTWKFDDNFGYMESREYLDQIMKEFNDLFKTDGLLLNKTSVGIRFDSFKGYDISIEAFFIKVPRLDYKIEIFRIEKPLVKEYPITVFNSIVKQNEECWDIESLKEAVERITTSRRLNDIINNLRSRVLYAY